MTILSPSEFLQELDQALIFSNEEFVAVHVSTCPRINEPVAIIAQLEADESTITYIHKAAFDLDDLVDLTIPESIFTKKQLLTYLEELYQNQKIRDSLFNKSTFYSEV